jgi:hypothetical protein
MTVSGFVRMTATFGLAKTNLLNQKLGRASIIARRFQYCMISQKSAWFGPLLAECEYRLYNSSFLIEPLAIPQSIEKGETIENRRYSWESAYPWKHRQGP